MLDEVLHEFSDALLPTIISIVLLIFLFGGMSYNGENGILNIAGTVPTHEETDDLVHMEPDKLNEFATAKMPDIQYKNLVYTIEEDIILDSIFTVTKDGITYDGTEGSTGGFTIMIDDVKNARGKSVLEISTKEALEQNEEALYSMIYIEETKSLYFLESGAYTVTITVRLTTGAKARYNVTIPITTNE